MSLEGREKGAKCKAVMTFVFLPKAMRRYSVRRF